MIDPGALILAQHAIRNPCSISVSESDIRSRSVAGDTKSEPDVTMTRHLPHTPLPAQTFEASSRAACTASRSVLPTVTMICRCCSGNSTWATGAFDVAIYLATLVLCWARLFDDLSIASCEYAFPDFLFG